MKLTYENSFVKDYEIKSYASKVKKSDEKLYNGTGEGSNFLGWLIPKVDEEEYNRIKSAAKSIREKSDVLIVIGIGGSYLGARAVIEALSHTFNSKKVLFAGNNMNPDYMNDLLDYIKDKEVCLNVISKSGTTTEPAISFQILKNFMEEKYGVEEARKRIYVTTDKEKGVLRKQALDEGYETFVVPDNIGGRYSVLTAVGLLPIAASGIDIDKIIEGAQSASKDFENDLNSICYKYAVIRNILYRKGKKIELLVNYEPKLHYFTEWWKQLFGESEGKNEKGIFPVGIDCTTDLHSMGQYIQEGERHLFETVINVQKPYRDITLGQAEIPELSFLSNKSINEINHKAMEGTVIAHTNGKVPNMMITVEKMDEHTMGELIYFFEKACGMSGYLLGINPFDQPGVEAYKKEMFKLLGKEK